MKTPGDNQKEQKGRPTRMMSAVEGHFQGRVLAGILQLVPLMVTALVLWFIIDTAQSYVRLLPFVEGKPWDKPGLGIGVLIVAFYLIGLIITFGFGRWLLGLIEHVLLRIPVVKVIYRLMLQVTNVVASDYGFSRVVFVEWPREGMVAMGFVTGRVIAKDNKRSLVSVYIPTVPNPTSGNMAFVHEDDVMETNISVDAAMKLVFSGGFVLPDSLSMARVPRSDADVNADFLGGFEADTSFRTKGDRSQESASKDELGAPAVGGVMPKGTEAGKAS